MSDEDASDLYTQQVVRVGLVEFRERHDTRTSGQHYALQQTAGRPIRLPSGTGKSPTSATSSQHPREDVARVGRVGVDVTRMLRGNCSRGI